MFSAESLLIEALRRFHRPAPLSRLIQAALTLAAAQTGL
jgi:hypothetical protein